jgi:hypothetical protein
MTAFTHAGIDPIVQSHWTRVCRQTKTVGHGVTHYTRPRTSAPVVPTIGLFRAGNQCHLWGSLCKMNKSTSPRLTLHSGHFRLTTTEITGLSGRGAVRPPRAGKSGCAAPIQQHLGIGNVVAVILPTLAFMVSAPRWVVLLSPTVAIQNQLQPSIRVCYRGGSICRQSPPMYRCRQRTWYGWLEWWRNGAEVLPGTIKRRSIYS